jgi:glycerophosphoryl diester phosphodiesterase
MAARRRALAGLGGRVTARPLVIAHRGASGERPENTLSAYARAVEQRADMIEIDLHRTRDGAIVVAHDECLPGLPGGREIGECSLADVRASASGERAVPTLDEVLDGFGARIPFNLEIKTSRVHAYPGIETEALAALERRGLGATILFSSFDDAVLGRLRAAAPRARLGVLVSSRDPARWRERCAEFGAEAVHFSKGLATASAVEAAHAARLAVYVYTVDQVAEMRELLARGCDGLFTNFPARMRALLESGSPEGSDSGSPE